MDHNETPGTPQPEPLGGTPAFEPAGGKKPAWQWIAAGAAGVAIAGAAFFGVNAMSSDGSASPTSSNANASTAAGQGNQRPTGFPGASGTAGTITSIDGATLTVETSDGTAVTVATSDETTVTTTEDGTVSDIEVGDNLLVTGSGSDSDIEAERIVDGGTEELGNGFPGRPDGNGPPGDGNFTPPNGGNFTPPNGGDFSPPNGGDFSPPNGGDFTPPVGGTVTAVDGSTITVETGDGDTVTITTTGSTDVVLRHSAEVGDLAEGDQVVVMGETNGDVVEATVVSEGDIGGFGPGGGFPGAPSDGSTSNDADDLET